jgi:hypothetical protein
MLRLTLDTRPVRDLCCGQSSSGRTWVSSVSIAPPLLRALASGTANIMQSWELTALLNDNLKSQKAVRYTKDDNAQIIAVRKPKRMLWSSD